MAEVTDWSAFTDAELSTLLSDARTCLTRILTGAQSGSVGAGRMFTMASIKDLKALIGEVSLEVAERADTGGGFILAEFGEPQ